MGLKALLVFKSRVGYVFRDTLPDPALDHVGATVANGGDSSAKEQWLLIIDIYIAVDDISETRCVGGRPETY